MTHKDWASLVPRSNSQFYCCLQYTEVWGEPTKLYLMSDIRMERMVGVPGNKAILMSFIK